MAIYVDSMKTKGTENIHRGGWRYEGYCHLTADSKEELIDFAIKIGLKEEWLQMSNKGIVHFDLTRNKRKLALKHGAKEK